jgi:hypothetical protein
MFYIESGELIGCEIRMGGWPAGADPRDPETSDKAAQLARKQRIELTPEFSGWVDYNCPCSRTSQFCQCPYALIPNHYFNGKVLFPKPALSIKLNDEVVVDGIASAAPESKATLALLAAVPNGHTVVVENAPGSNLLVEPVMAVFTNGVSTDIAVIVPPQGVVGLLQWRSKYVRTFQLSIRGWA